MLPLIRGFDYSSTDLRGEQVPFQRNSKIEEVADGSFSRYLRYAHWVVNSGPRGGGTDPASGLRHAGHVAFVPLQM